MAAWRKLGLVAGGGQAPVALADAYAAAGREIFVARIAGAADPALNRFPGAEFALGAVGARFKALKAAGCDAVCLVGALARPDFSTLKLDAAAMVLLPKVLAASRTGDDALLRVLVEAFEAQGFRVVGAHEAMADFAAPAGALGALSPSPEAMADIEKGAAVAAALGAWDIAQGVVVAGGLVLAVEAAEGTDAMLARLLDLPEAIRGRPGARRGVLVKRPKPQQDRRIDLPTLGLATIEHAARAGLAGVAYEAGGALLIGRADAMARADALGLFMFGFPA